MAKKLEGRSQMAFLIIFVIALILAGIAMGYLVYGGPEKRSDIDWWTDLDDALDNASATGRPLMVDFMADWCRYCSDMESDTFADRRVEDRAEEFVAVKVDTDEHESAVSQYEISGLPTVIFMDPTGAEVHRVEGYMGPSDFLVEMDRALDLLA